MRWQDALAWSSIIQWLAIAGVFFYDSLQVHKRVLRQYRTALAVGNGRVLVAKKHNEISRWYIIGTTIALAIGLLSAYSNAFLPHPPADTRVAGVIIREGIVVMLFAFWRTKRGNVALYREFDRRGAQAREAEDAEDAKAREAIYDLQEKVTEIQTRGQDDQPLEQVDRTEGHDHRTSIDARLQADTDARTEERKLDREERADERRDEREERADERP